MMKKIGAVTLGVAASLVAAAPFASATESQAPSLDQTCSFAGGDQGNGVDISGDSFGNAVAQAGVGGSNVGNLLNCSNFLNDNVNGNHVTILDF